MFIPFIKIIQYIKLTDNKLNINRQNNKQQQPRHLYYIHCMMAVGVFSVNIIING